MKVTGYVYTTKFIFMEEMTVQQYAKIRKVSSAAVTRAIGRNDKMIGVKSFRKIGRDWILVISRTEAESLPKKYLVTQE